MKALRTPDDRFRNLPGWSFEPHYADVDGLRVHYVDEGPRDAAPVVLLHGEPSWSYLYRRMIGPIAAAGHRVIAPDLVGFGRSDKPAKRSDYTYQSHIDWMRGLLFDTLALSHITLFCQDWGGLIGLRMVGEHPDRFDRVVAANTFLPTGDMPLGEAFHRWRAASQTMPVFDVARIIKSGLATEPPAEVLAAYDAPFPDESYKEGARQFPTLVPATPEDPATPANRAAWAVLGKWTKPFLTAFGDSDPITRGGDQALQAMIPGAKGQKHVTVEKAGHFLQEDQGERLAAIVNGFVAATR